MWNHFAVPHEPSAGLHRILTVFREPFVHVEEEILFAPKHPGERLAQNKGLIICNPLRRDGAIKLVRLVLASLQDFSKALEGIAYHSRCQIA
jgi:hypothetical protein